MVVCRHCDHALVGVARVRQRGCGDDDVGGFFKGRVTAHGPVVSDTVYGCIVGRCIHMQRAP